MTSLTLFSAVICCSGLNARSQDKAFAVGGDEALKDLQDEKTNRFKPVVLFDGPFSLKAGATQKHTFKMPEYIGEVRTMVIAATNGQYGAASVNSTVNKPLMVSVVMSSPCCSCSMLSGVPLSL